MYSGKSPSPKPETSFVPSSSAPEATGYISGLSDRLTVFLVCFFLAAIVWLVFGQTVHFAFFNCDDGEYVYENPAVTSGLNLNGVKWAFTHIVSSNWHPLTMLSLKLDCQMYGLNAGGHHLTNVLLHTASVILLFLMLRQMTGKLWRSAMVAATFAIHPLRAESVAWVAERKDVLSGVFFMLTLWAYVRYTSRLFSIGRYLWLAILFALGLLCKPMLVTLPFVLLLLDYWPLGRFQLTTPRATLRTFRPLLLEKIPLFLLAAVISIITFTIQGNAEVALEKLPVERRLENVIVSYGTYVWEMIWPRNLGVHYPFVSSVPIWQIVIGGGFLLTLTVLAIRLARRNAYIIVGWFWYLGMLVPVIGLTQVGSQSHADRYTYLPQIGLYLLLTWAAADLCNRWYYRRVVLGVASTMILVILIFCARAQVSYWQNSESLWTHTLACTSNNAFAHNNLGRELYSLGRKDEATVHFRQAVQINPRFAPAQDNLGLALFQMGQTGEAIIHLQQALQIDPKNAEIHDHLGNMLLNLGRNDEAIIHFQQALQINPQDADAENDLGFTLFQNGQKDEAIAHLRKALQINPQDAKLENNLGFALLQIGQKDEAMVRFRRALQINPRQPEIQATLAWELATSPLASLRDGRQAVELAGQANQAAGEQNPRFLRTLAAAYAEAGRFDDAVRSAKKARVLAQATGQSDLTEQLDDQLKLYQAGLPFHQQSK